MNHWQRRGGIWALIYITGTNVKRTIAMENSMTIPQKIKDRITIFQVCICVSACVCSTHSESCPTLCDPESSSPPGSFVHRLFQEKNTEVGCHFLLQRIFLTQGTDMLYPLSLLHWQMDSFPLLHSHNYFEIKVYLSVCLFPSLLKQISNYF